MHYVKTICLNNKDKCMIISTRLLSKYIILYYISEQEFLVYHNNNKQNIKNCSR